jgi:hypothetical protein
LFNNVNGVFHYFLSSYWSEGFGKFFPVTAFAFSLAGGFCKLCANERRKLLLQRHPP